MDKERLKAILRNVTTMMSDEQISQMLFTFNILYKGSLREEDGGILPELLEAITDIYSAEYPVKIEDDSDETIIPNPEVFPDDEDVSNELRGTKPVELSIVQRKWLKQTRDEIIAEKDKIEKALDPSSNESKLIKYLRKVHPEEITIDKVEYDLNISSEDMEKITDQFTEGLIGVPHVIYDKKRRTFKYHDYAIGRTI